MKQDYKRGREEGRGGGGASRVHDFTDNHFTLEDVDASNGGLESDNYFVVARTPLNIGYVYLFNADDPNDFHELEVDEVGNISHVLWGGANMKEDGSTPKDCRKKEKATSHYMLILKEEMEKMDETSIVLLGASEGKGVVRGPYIWELLSGY